MSVISRPKAIEGETDVLKRRQGYRGGVGYRGDLFPLPFMQCKGFKSAGIGIHQPQVRDALAGVDVALVAEIKVAGGGGQNLAHPIRGQGDERCHGALGHALAPPAGEVGHEDVFVREGAEVNFRLVENPPAVRPAAVFLVCAADLYVEGGTRRRMGHSRARVGVKPPVHDFGDFVRRGVEHILIGGFGAGLLSPLPSCLSGFGLYCRWRIHGGDSML